MTGKPKTRDVALDHHDDYGFCRYCAKRYCSSAACRQIADKDRAIPRGFEYHDEPARHR